MRQLMINLTVITLISCIAEILAPDGNFKKYIRLVLSLIVMIIIANPILDISQNIKIDFENMSSESERIDKKLQNIQEKQISELNIAIE